MTFFQVNQNIQTHFRSIILLGANTATYKFALAKSLLELSSTNKTFVSLDDLSPIFAKHLISHVGTGKKQINGHGTSKLLNALHLHHQGQISKELMLNITRVEGFKCVLDAFHNLPAKQQALPFFKKAVIEKK